MQTLNYVETKPKFNKKANTVLFLHGWGGSTNSFLFAQKYLEFNYHTINIDFLGFGKSGMPKKVMDTYAYALQIYEFLKRKKIKKLSIVAHSFGGRVAILLSTIFNLEIEKLVLVSSAGVKTRKSIFYFLKLYSYKVFKWLVKRKLLPQKVLKNFGSKDYKQLNETMKKCFISIVNQKLNVYLPLIKAETLLVWGKKDKATPFYMAKVMHKLISNSKLLVYKGAGHFSYLEEAPKFHSAILKFLKK